MPTVEGPYTMVKHVEQQGSQSILKKFGNKIGGRATTHNMVLAKKDAATGQTGEVPAQDAENNSEYLVTVGIGTPAQNMTLDFDTGSADLWVFSTELPSSDIGSQTVFDPTKSSTWKASTGETWNITYGDGSSASGNVGTDQLNVGGLVVNNQAIELAEQASSQFLQGSGSGLLGLAFDSINTVTPSPVATPVENMVTQKDIPTSAELFTAWLADTTDNSFYTFGFIDQASLGGVTPSYTPVDNSQGFWMFNSTSASVNGKTITRSGNTAIADTGTTLCLVADDVLSAYYGAISGAKQDSSQQGWVYPSSVDPSSLPSIELAVGDTLYTVNGEDIAFQDLGNGFIYGGLQSRGQQNFDIFGDVFLRSVYAIFDLNGGTPQFGCVQRQPSGTSGGNTAPSTGTTGSS